METILAAIASAEMPLDPAVKLIVFPGEGHETIRLRRGDALVESAAIYAQQRHVFVVPGLYVQECALCLCLVDDRGQVVLEQKATHLNRSWAGDLQRGNEIRVAETPFGKVALCVDVDVYKAEVLRITALQGAEIVVSVQVIHTLDFTNEMILAGAWQQAQQNCLFILNTNNINGSIIGPCETAGDLSGFLTPISNEYPLQAQLSAGGRAAAYRDFPIFKSLNPPLYRRHIDELCSLPDCLGYKGFHAVGVSAISFQNSDLLLHHRHPDRVPVDMVEVGAAPHPLLV